MQKTVTDLKAQAIYEMYKGFYNKIVEDASEDVLESFDTDKAEMVAAELTKTYFNLPEQEVTTKSAYAMRDAQGSNRAPEEDSAFKDGVLKL